MAHPDTPTEQPPKKGTRITKRRLRFAPSFMIGLLLVPVSAVAANFLITSTPAEVAVVRYPSFNEQLWQRYLTASSEADTAPETVPTTTPSTDSEDLALACGAEGLALVAREAAEIVSGLEQAALAALRPICEEAGMPLPAAPEPPPIIQTVTVVQASSDASPAVDPQFEAFVAAYSSAETAINVAIAEEGTIEVINSAIDRLADAQAKAEQGDYGKAIEKAAEAESLANEAVEFRVDDNPPPDDGSNDGSPDAFAVVRASAQAAIDSAVAAGGNQEKIAEAVKKLADADKKAAEGNYAEAIKKAGEAQKKANEALG